MAVASAGGRRGPARASPRVGSLPRSRPGGLDSLVDRLTGRGARRRGAPARAARPAARAGLGPGCRWRRSCSRSSAATAVGAIAGAARRARGPGPPLAPGRDRRCPRPASSSPTRCSSGGRAGAGAICSASLPDALDLLAVGADSGRGAAAGFDEIARSGERPARRRAADGRAELACGVPLSIALAGLRERVPGSELATLCASIERSRRFGSPLADQLRRQATALRRDQRRARRGARRPRRPEDPARRRPGPRPLGPADDRRRPDRQRRRPARRLLSKPALYSVASSRSRVATAAVAARIASSSAAFFLSVDVAAEVAADELEGELLRRRVGQPDDEGGGEELAQPVESWLGLAKIS